MENANHTFQWACGEASRCLFCIDAPCTKGCPTHIDIPRFIRLLRWKDIRGAKQMIKAENCFGAVCGYLCPSEKLCEKDCLRARIDSPIEIAALQRFACNNADYEPAFNAKSRTGKKVAVIGAGPAGITCAMQLTAFGHEVEIFEREKYLAGTISKEIPHFKIPPEVVDRELGELGTERIKVRVGIEVKPELLENETGKRFDAVFLGVGLSQSHKSRLQKKGVKNVYDASMFLNSVKSGSIGPIKGICVIIGGGDTAIDCARTALRLGAKRSVIAYRRSRNEMPAAEAGFIQAAKEGVEFLWQLSPVCTIGQKEVAEIEFVRTELMRSRQGGRRAFKRVSASKFRFPADIVVLALGKGRDAEFTSILNDQRVNAETLQIENTKYFVGGDLINAGETVVEAVADGKKAAISIDRYLNSM